MEGQEAARRIDGFLDLYKQLEDALEDKYRNARRHYSSVVYEFEKDYESAPVRDKLEVCREIRNLLTHTANLDGEPVVEPSQPVVDALQEVLDFVKQPPLALEFATKGDQVMKAHMHQKVLRLMEVMDKNGYSHILSLIHIWRVRGDIGLGSHIIQLFPAGAEGGGAEAKGPGEGAESKGAIADHRCVRPAGLPLDGIGCLGVTQVKVGGAVAAEHPTCGEAHGNHLAGDAQFFFVGPQQPDGALHIRQGVIPGVGLEPVGQDSGVKALLGKVIGHVHAFAAGAAGKPAAVGLSLIHI